MARLADEPAPAPDSRELTREDVLLAASSVINRVGVDRFTMRGLAAELNFSTMAAYRHVQNKDDVLHATADSILARVVIAPDDDRPWADRFHDFAMAVWKEIEGARWIPGYLISAPTPLPNLSRIFDELSRILDEAGLSSDDARSSKVMSWAFTVGLLSWIDEPGPYLRFGVEVISAGLEKKAEEAQRATGRGSRRSAQPPAGGSAPGLDRLVET